MDDGIVRPDRDGAAAAPGRAQARRGKSVGRGASLANTGYSELRIDRPSVNVVVYGDGRERFYLLSELPAQNCEWGADGRSWRLGD